jgi:hypothetical protein
MKTIFKRLVVFNSIGKLVKFDNKIKIQKFKKEAKTPVIIRVVTGNNFGESFSSNPSIYGNFFA